MASTPWIIVIIAIIIILLAVVALLLTKKKKTPPDYYALFILGVVWLPLGIASENSTFWILGIVFLAIGLANKKKWKENRTDWGKLDKTQKKWMIGLIAFLTILVLAGTVIFFLTKNGLISF